MAFTVKKYLQVAGAVSGARFFMQGTPEYQQAIAQGGKVVPAGTQVMGNPVMPNQCQIDGKTRLVRPEWLGDTPPAAPAATAAVPPSPFSSDAAEASELMAAMPNFGGLTAATVTPTTPVPPAEDIAAADGGETPEEPPAWEFFDLDRLVADMTGEDPQWRSAIYQAIYSAGDSELLRRYFPTADPVPPAADSDEEIEIDFITHGQEIEDTLCVNCTKAKHCEILCGWDESSADDELPDEWSRTHVECDEYDPEDEEESEDEDGEVYVATPQPQSHITHEWLKRGDSLERLMEILKRENPSLFNRYRKRK